MKLSRLLTWVVFLSIFAMAARVSIDTDTWWHLRAGQWMVENSALMEVDSFSYTRGGTPWQYPGLWIEVLLFLIYQWVGPGGLNIFTAAMVTLTFWVVWKTLSSQGFLAAFVMIIAAAASGIYWSARPYLISFLLSAILVFLFEAYHNSRKKNLWVVPALMVLWVNSHGAFLIGLLIWLCYFVGISFEWVVAYRQKEDTAAISPRLKHLLIIGILLGLSMFVSPQGIDLLSLPFTTVSRGAEQLFIEEWQSPNFHEARMLPFAVLLLLTFGAMGFSKQRVTLTEYLLVAGFGLMGLVSARFISIFAVVAPVILVRHGEAAVSFFMEQLNVSVNINLDKMPTQLQSWLNKILVVLLAIVTLYKISLVMPTEANFEVFRESLPVDAVDFIKQERPEGRMFNAYNFGGYLIWALPEYPVFIDGRADLHGDEVVFEWYRTVQGLDGWKDTLDKWEIGFVLVEPEMPLTEKLKGENWGLIYADETAVIYQK